MARRGPGMPRNTRIAVIGAGAGGLSVAHYLRRLGYENVTVFERLGRVGGLCRTMTEDGRAYDLGANYVTPAYRETLSLASSLGMKTYVGKAYTAAWVPSDSDGDITYKQLQEVLRDHPEDPQKDNKTPRVTFVKAVLKFFWLRLKLKRVIDRPGLAAVTKRKDLHVSFQKWLETQKLTCLIPMFRIPITMMGYGYLKDIAAPYALKYMTLGTYWAMVMNGIRSFKWISPWPRRFELGYQRLFELVSWHLDVRLNTEILEIRRRKDPQSVPDDVEAPIWIRFRHKEQAFYGLRAYEDELAFDKLIVACPISPESLGPFLHLSEKEFDLFRRVRTYSYCMTTMHVEGGLPIPDPIVCVLPFTEASMGRPWAVAQMWKDGEAPLVQFYSRVPSGGDEDEDRAAVRDAAKALVKRMLEQEDRELPKEGPNERRWQTYNRWAYFQHVKPEDIGDGFYEKLEELQGQNDTYYVGGPTSFQLIEPILEYSKALAEQRFGRAR